MKDVVTFRLKVAAVFFVIAISFVRGMRKMCHKK